MGQPATAAIIVACIFIGIGAAFVGYKIYRKVYYYRQRKAYEETLPPVRQPFSAYNVPGRGSLSGIPGSGLPYQTGSGAQSTLVSPYSTFGKAGSYDALTNPSAVTPPQGSPSDALVGVDDVRSPNGSVVAGPYDRTRNSSQAGSITASHYDSAPHSPTAGSAHLPGVRDTRSFDAGSEFGGSFNGSQHLHSRSLNGSTSSTMALRKSYVPSVYKGSSTSHIGLAAPTTHAHRRESYLPHNPSNREGMMIVPPQPLGFGTVNSMAMGTDQKTLAFSSISGIGASDDFSNHFSWVEQQNATAGSSGNAAAARGSVAAPPAAAAERERYLREGPSAGLLSRTSSPGARVDSRNSSRSGSDLNARTAGVSSSSSPSSSARALQYPPSAAQFRGLHHFAMHHQSHGSMHVSDSASNNAQPAIEESSPIMSPYRVQGATVIPGPTSTEANRAALAHEPNNATRSSASGSDRVSASVSQTGSSGAGMEDPSTGPTTAYTGSSGRPSKHSGSFKDDGVKTAQDGATGPEDPPPEAEKAPGVVSNAAHYGAGLLSHAGQRLRAAAGS